MLQSRGRRGDKLSHGRKLASQTTEVLSKYPGLRLTPSSDGLELVGTLRFSAEHDGFGLIDDEYELSIKIPSRFPRELPKTRDCGKRIPRSFHTNGDRSLCLGAPARQILALGKDGTISDYVDLLVIPYLYGYSYFEKHGELPFGELEHGTAGLLCEYAKLFGVTSEKAVPDLIRLASMKKRVANKRPCPCGGGKRLGKCHNRQVNALRDKLGRLWFSDEVRKIQQRSWGS